MAFKWHTQTSITLKDVTKKWVCTNANVVVRTLLVLQMRFIALLNVLTKNLESGKLVS
ncbi:MAG: hypothetical protein WD650_01225 [Nitrosopumilaceae archaeon]